MSGEFECVADQLAEMVARLLAQDIRHDIPARGCARHRPASAPSLQSRVKRRQTPVAYKADEAVWEATEPHLWNLSRGFASDSGVACSELLPKGANLGRQRGDVSASRGLGVFLNFAHLVD